MKFISIIITHFASGKERSDLFRKSLDSLIVSTKLPYELIIIDNGGDIEDSRYLLDLTEKGIINTYIRNSNNMHFGFARNQALRICNGDYIAVCDNDILYKNGWLEACIDVLDQNPDEKIYATPIYNVTHNAPKFWRGEVQANGQTYKLNSRSGSNCWVTRRKDFEVIGEFPIHRIAGTKWTNLAIIKGYLAAVTPEKMIEDGGFRHGYDFKVSKPVILNLHNGKNVYFNVDEYINTDITVFKANQKTFHD
jgi:glycosyltransferase involved in cell wall biosynthesis